MRIPKGLVIALCFGALAAQAEELNFDGPNAFRLPRQDLSVPELANFNYGSGLFHLEWQSVPDHSGTMRGLGPLYSATSCDGCHIRDGRGLPPEGPGASLGGLVLVFGHWTGPDEGEVAAHPRYGHQVQDLAVEGVSPELAVSVSWAAAPVPGDPEGDLVLRRPVFTLSDGAGGPVDDHLLLAPRLAPPLIGLGLLADIPAVRLEALADPEDRDGDGISGRINFVSADGVSDPVPGRFGWKGNISSVHTQTGFAATYDMGLTVSRFVRPEGDCTEAQIDCQDIAGGAPILADYDLDANQFRLLTFYTENLAVPPRRIGDAEEVSRGEALFTEIGCAACHVSTHVTGDGSEITPYTDLLLHDMGEGLADNLAVGLAGGSEWQTPPLWGIGRTHEVSGGAFFLHDGRARGLEEAILWHGGEAEMAQTSFRQLPGSEQQALLSFLNSL